MARVAQSAIDIGDIKAFVDAISSLLEVFQVCVNPIREDFLVLTSAVREQHRGGEATWAHC